MSLILPLAILLAWHISEKGGSWRTYSLLFICSILALLTRLDISAVILAAEFFFLLFADRRAALTIVAAGVLGVMLNPFWWNAPALYASALFEKYLFYLRDISSSLTLWQLLYSAPISALGVAIAAVSLSQKRALPLPRNFLLWLLTMSLITFALLWRSAYHPIWYFLPLIVIWQILCPLLLLSLFERRAREEWIVILFCILSFAIAMIMIPFSVAWA
ncbi:MAG: hypothetical protein A3C11_01295 [Candidatus Sungbacteria bacterium RIFCSPHIGHO2_02_FULL_49_12]|uniref:Glycosyltransferase RgtA/B/C/D-like domain-containing protein n=1 Tax=Candidatus Sungbacteria bacterium RIFCSPHIGHO2_02_FULL_49_12 TaxID=1802271 RepID=A0A1G2KNW2_9BACT|nr:MAG: hypothetical protein A3C11_01295 [Candidatus Sungbacteria bacterium RIFCSPHIGHO2_02_FULL_49_12]